MFRDREDAGRQLADSLRGRELVDPLVMGIPRGGVIIGAVLAREIGADLDVALARKLRARNQPEFAIGAVSEDGDVWLNPDVNDPEQAYLEAERDHQLAEIARRRALYRQVCPAASVLGRSVILTDDGIATGATMMAALRVFRQRRPRDLTVAVPVGSPDRLEEVGRLADDVVCVHGTEDFMAIGQFYEDFTQVEDAEVLEALQSNRDWRAESGRCLTSPSASLSKMKER